MPQEYNVTYAARTALPTSSPMVRRTNLSLVLRHLRDHGFHSRADIAEVTGLHRATVSHLVVPVPRPAAGPEVGVDHAGAVGRPRRPLALHGAHVGALGLEINVDYVPPTGRPRRQRPGRTPPGLRRDGQWPRLAHSASSA